MQAPPVPKIKAFLGDIKANYLDDEGAASDAQSTFQALLKMELLLRGVIVEDDNKLWQQVLSSAGKALMTENTIPKPLLSGANVMAGRVAEVCFNNRHLFRPNLSASSSALQRAKELKDQRFIILLQQDFDALEVAKGYFIRAAQSNPDKPPMFKKVWDIMVTQHSDDAPFEAQHAIENLIRIISSKGNAKRSTELRLKLIESYLNEDRENRNNSVSNLFADSDAAKPPTDVHALAELARDTLNECALNDLSDSDRIMYKILQLRVEMALESATIERTGQEQYQVDKNRSKAASIDAVRSKCQKQVFMQSEDPIQEVSFELRDVLLQLWSSSGSTDSTNDSHFLLCLGWVQKALLRLRDRAQVRGEDEAWIVVLQYIQELIDGVKKLCSWNLEMPRNNRIEKMLAWFNARPMQERELLSAVASIFPTAYWMSLKSEIEPMEEIFHLLLDVFSVLQQQDLEAEETQSDAVGSKSKTSAKRLQWKHARSIVMCFLCQDDPDIIFQITREAVARKGSDTKSPLGILQCLVSWSGWFQSPWPHCSNITHARRLLAAAKVDSGRPLSLLEEVLLDLAHADAELLQGGFANDAGNLYLKVQETVKEDSSLDEGTKALLLAHCNNGLARTCQVGITIPNQVSIEEYAQGVLHTLQKTHHISRLQVWHVPTALSASFTHQRSVARQLIADSLVGVGRCEEARVFLDAAVNDSPSDAPAAFSFGAFLLRMAFYVNKERSEEADKMAQVQLLKAAKLDPSKAKPFALLGFWFEEKGDLARAKGCYSKSLALDPCDPVAGRGILRLETYENSKQFLDVAIDGNSSLNGWAWQAIGLHKIFVEGEDDLAIVALLKALRCRDIMQIRNEPLGIFYQQQGENVNEEATVLEETGQCYRRLGRYTAAIRAFHAAIDAYHSDMTPPSSVLCSCAQVELELALFEDAAEKFAKVLEYQVGGIPQPIAAYGQGIALLSIAQRDLQDGKVGSAFASIQKAIKGCIEFTSDFSCIYKLLGDLYSFGASVPPSVFKTPHEQTEGGVLDCIEKQLKFVSRGEGAYRSALKFHEATKGDDSYNITRASCLCDAACNILLQAKIISTRCKIDRIHSDADEMYEQAAKEFENAIDCNPLHAAAWCGLGCAVKDPLLAQHAFCRCLQIERMLPDGYANIGFLYTELEAYTASEETMNALTQVADTPMMWINRAFMLERKAALDVGGKLSTGVSRKISQAADAYRAALQIMKQPDAMIGLAVTGRVVSDGETRKSRSIAHTANRKDSSALMKEFLAASSHFQKEALLLSGVFDLEQAAETDRLDWGSEALKRGQKTVKGILSDKDLSISLDTNTIEACLVDVEQISTTEENETLDSQEAIQRQILREPNRSDLWLLLAKQFVSTLEKSSPPHVVEAAFRAANRACSMLTQTMASPHRIDGRVALSVRSDMVSESLALIYHLKSFQPDKEESLGSPTYDLQRSLIMCPSNPLAREALNSAS